MNKNKDLLLKYLCMALPYEVKGLRTYNKEEVAELSGILPCNASRNSDRTFIELQFTNLDCCVVDKYKPYLRPMSSMTDEECKELGELPATINNIGETFPNTPYYIEVARVEQINWLLEHHFDFMGLIPKGLAIEVTKDNNPYKE